MAGAEPQLILPVYPFTAAVDPAEGHPGELLPHVSVDHFFPSGGGSFGQEGIGLSYGISVPGLSCSEASSSSGQEVVLSSLA
jgi:hypothetical protein